jgi:SnoaL-like domain
MEDQVSDNQPQTAALVERLHALENEVRRLRDREAILDCIHRYARGLDRHDPEVLATAYHDDGVDRHGEPRSRDEFISWANAFHRADWTSHLHYMTNNRLGIDGDSAWSETYWFAMLKRNDETMVDIGGGRYVDQLTRENGQWKIMVRETIVDLQAVADAAEFGGPSASLHGTWDHDDPSYQGTFNQPDGSSPGEAAPLG